VINYSDPTALINDPRVILMPEADTGESLIDARQLDIDTDESRDGVQLLSDNPFRVRITAAQLLTAAQAALPSGFRLQLKEAWRPRWVQQRLWDEGLERLRQQAPNLDTAALADENARFVAPADQGPPHSTGGAVDVVLTKDHAQVDMGWGFNEPGTGSHTDADVSKSARYNRDVLITAMHSSGFVNYPQEWWHWSYGDRYWAFQTGSAAALYGSADR
jgi:D-alanyl-D-alanine dipeptidase